MNFDEAINAHAQWKTKLRSLIAGNGDVDIPKLTVDNACPLGQWIYGEGAKFAALPAYQKLRLAHAAFHKLAASVAYRAKSGDASAATASLEGHAYEAASHEVVTAINALRKVAEGTLPPTERSSPRDAPKRRTSDEAELLAKRHAPE